MVIGVFLLVAAAMKLHGLAQGALAQGLLSSPRLQIAAMEAEVVIGLWLLWGAYARGAWWATVMFFTLLATASAYLGLAGQTSCGCFGVIEVNPWATFGLDVGILAVLGICHPRPSVESESRLPVRQLMATAGGVAAILAILTGSFYLLLGNPSRALAQLRGEPIAVSPAVSDVGEAVGGEESSFALTLTNYTSEPVRIIGGTTSCACIATEDLPITLPPGESGTMNVRIRFTGTPGRFQHRFTLFTDNNTQPEITPRFRGRVLAVK